MESDSIYVVPRANREKALYRYTNEERVEVRLTNMVRYPINAITCFVVAILLSGCENAIDSWEKPGKWEEAGSNLPPEVPMTKAAGPAFEIVTEGQGRVVRAGDLVRFRLRTTWGWSDANGREGWMWTGREPGGGLSLTAKSGKKSFAYPPSAVWGGLGNPQVRASIIGMRVGTTAKMDVRKIKGVRP